MWHNNGVTQEGEFYFMIGYRMPNTPGIWCKWILQHHTNKIHVWIYIQSGMDGKHFVKLRKCCFACAINEKRCDYNHHGCILCSILKRILVPLFQLSPKPLCVCSLRQKKNSTQSVPITAMLLVYVLLFYYAQLVKWHEWVDRGEWRETRINRIVSVIVCVQEIFSFFAFQIQTKSNLVLGNNWIVESFELK